MAHKTSRFLCLENLLHMRCESMTWKCPAGMEAQHGVNVSPKKAQRKRAICRRTCYICQIRVTYICRNLLEVLSMIRRGCRSVTVAVLPPAAMCSAGRLVLFQHPLPWNHAEMEKFSECIVTYGRLWRCQKKLEMKCRSPVLFLKNAPDAYGNWCANRPLGVVKIRRVS